MPALDYTLFEYRGNQLDLVVGVSYEGSHLRAEFGGGMSETETIFPGLLYAHLKYEALSNRVIVPLAQERPVSRLEYVWNFYRESMDNGRRPFRMRVPPPLEQKLYLWEFTELNLELSAVDRYLATTGLGVKQVVVRGVETLPDGSVADSVDNPASI